MVSSLFSSVRVSFEDESSVTVSFEDETSEGRTGSTAVSTFRLSSGLDSVGSFSMIDTSADHLGGSAGFSTIEGLGASFWYPGGSRNGETGRSYKTLFASSKNGHRWMACSPSHNIQGDLGLPLRPSLSLVDGLQST